MNKIDPSALDSYREIMGEEADKFVSEVLQTYQENSRMLLAQLDESLARGDVITFTRTAHTLKSSSATIGAVQVAALAKILEDITASGFPPNIEADLQRLKNEWAEASQEIQRLLKKSET